jgi:hypothetical protein
MGFHKDEAMRGKHLVDTKTGELWPWTSTLSKKPGFKLADDAQTFIEEHAAKKVEAKPAPRLKLPRNEQLDVPEDASIADAMTIYTHAAGKKVK